MNKILEETLAHEKPDPAFEQRMLSGFRSRIPQRTGLVKLLADLMRLRATQITAVAAVLLALVQIGRMITGEGAAVSRDREYVRRRIRGAADATITGGVTDDRNPARCVNRTASGERQRTWQLEKPAHHRLAEICSRSSRSRQARPRNSGSSSSLKMRDERKLSRKNSSATMRILPARKNRNKIRRIASRGAGKPKTHPQRGRRTGDRQL